MPSVKQDHGKIWTANQLPALARTYCVNAIEFSRHGNLFASAGDDKRVLLWQTEDIIRRDEKACKPLSCMPTRHESNVFSLAFNADDAALASAGNDACIYVHDTTTSKQLHCFKHKHSIFEVNYHPAMPNVFLLADADGCIRMLDSRDNTQSRCAGIALARYVPAFYSVQFHPQHSRLFLTSHSSRGVALWDMRNAGKTCLIRYGGELGEWDCSCARFNMKGDRIAMLRKVYDGYALHVFSTNKPDLPLFRLGDRRYSNTATMKSCCFGGADDEYVCAGGDQSGHFGVFMWHIPTRNSRNDEADRLFKPTYDLQNALQAIERKKLLADEFDESRSTADEFGINQSSQSALATMRATFVLSGYRSITNQVRFDRERMLLATAGVENMIKVWSPFSFGNLGRTSDENEDEDRNQEQIDADMRHVYSLFDLLAASAERRHGVNSRNSLLDSPGSPIARASLLPTNPRRRRRRTRVRQLTVNLRDVNDSEADSSTDEDYADEIVDSPPRLSPVPFGTIGEEAEQRNDRDINSTVLTTTEAVLAELRSRFDPSNRQRRTTSTFVPASSLLSTSSTQIRLQERTAAESTEACNNYGQNSRQTDRASSSGRRLELPPSFEEQD